MAIESIVEKLVIPKIGDFTKWCKGQYNEHLIPKAEHFQEYLDRTYEKYSIINTLVFHNSQRQLKEIYVAQSLIKDTYYGYEEITKIDIFPTSLIKKYKKILIQDTAGMGKSTIMKRMFIDLIDSGMEEAGIPIYIELNRLKKDHTILMEIQMELNSLSREFDKELYLKLIQTGGFIFFLDGYDEISIADRSKVTQDIQTFISKAGPKNYYILTSRPEGNLTSFGDFQSFKIKPLSKEDAYELLEKYDMTDDKLISIKLIDLLKSGQYSSIDEYLENPLLVSLLYAAFDHKQTIPLKKHLFYRQVYEAYFDSHDLTKGIDAHQKRSCLDIDDFNRVLRYVGYECLIRIGVQFDKDTIIRSIDSARGFCGNLNFSSNDFLQDLLTTVPLFTKDGAEYRWAHKSLMEYFGARFIAEDAKEKQDSILQAICESKQIGKYLNMLDIYFDIDYKGFSKNITLPFCREFLLFRKEQKEEYDKNRRRFHRQIGDILIEERIGLLFFTSWAFLFNNRNKNKKIVSSDKDFQIKKFQKDMGNDAKIWRYFYSNDNVFWIAFKSNNILRLKAMLLLEKIPHLFIGNNLDDKNEFKKDAFSDYVDKVHHNEVIMVDVNHGLKSPQKYKGINSYMKDIHRSYLSYLSCEREVKRIEEELLSNSGRSDLLVGI